jgi:hypothetical protein
MPAHSVAEVRKQAEIGPGIVNDGEYGKTINGRAMCCGG